MSRPLPGGGRVRGPAPQSPRRAPGPTASARVIVMRFDQTGRRIETILTDEPAVVEKTRGWWSLLHGADPRW
jgi:hypothetical protein